MFLVNNQVVQGIGVLSAIIEFEGRSQVVLDLPGQNRSFSAAWAIAFQVSPPTDSFLKVVPPSCQPFQINP